MALDVDITQLGGIIGTLITAAYGSAFAVRALQKKWAAAGVDLQASAGANEIITQLRAENERIAKVCNDLAAKVNTLTLTNMELHQKILDEYQACAGVRRELADLKAAAPQTLAATPSAPPPIAEDAPTLPPPLDLAP